MKFIHLNGHVCLNCEVIAGILVADNKITVRFLHSEDLTITYNTNVAAKHDYHRFMSRLESI